MNSLAHVGPAPWILFFPLVWAAVILGGITLLRRAGLRGRPGPWQHAHAAHPSRPSYGERSPIAVLGRRLVASWEVVYGFDLIRGFAPASGWRPHRRTATG
ncbi:SHOCT domain-containing protein [Streptomyces chengbuensis]|uniref:SHOCT domain-containing protein n=1 Tax=Streptomyces chengbuensis TaxID=3053466 RepID=UPI0025B5E602|nr:SHOCT domain-containing protein [Streptomyces sp. HUAS CB01]WJY49033.1 SHOCT domain-containing protein [Streptomyces sp. HUAS CB01]